MKKEWHSLAKVVFCTILPVLVVACWLAFPAQHGAPPALSAKASVRSTSPIPSSPASYFVDSMDLESLRKLARSDAATARTAAARQGAEAVVAVAVALAKTDLTATEAWARTLEDPLHDAALSSLAVEVASDNPTDALRLARQLDDFDKRQQMMAHALAQFAATDPQAAWDALQKAAIPSERIALERVVLAAVAEHDPESVAQWLKGHRVPPEHAQSLTVSVAQRWTQQDPVAACTWIAALSDSYSRQQAAEVMMQIWSSQDAADAEAWLKSQPAGDARDEMAVALGSSLAARDCDTARNLATTIRNDVLRTHLLNRIDSQRKPAIVDVGHAAGGAGDCHAK